MHLQVAAAEQQSLRREAFTSDTAGAVRWHEADKDAAQADSFGAALSGNTAWRPQVTPTLAAAGGEAASLPAAGFSGSVLVTGVYCCSACCEMKLLTHSMYCHAAPQRES